MSVGRERRERRAGFDARALDGRDGRDAARHLRGHAHLGGLDVAAGARGRRRWPVRGRRRAAGDERRDAGRAMSGPRSHDRPLPVGFGSVTGAVRGGVGASIASVAVRRAPPWHRAPASETARAPGAESFAYRRRRDEEHQRRDDGHLGDERIGAREHARRACRRREWRPGSRRRGAFRDDRGDRDGGRPRRLRAARSRGSAAARRPRGRRPR